MRSLYAVWLLMLLVLTACSSSGAPALPPDDGGTPGPAVNRPPVLQAALVNPSGADFVLGPEGVIVAVSLAGSQDPENAPGTLSVVWGESPTPVTTLLGTNADLPATVSHTYATAGDYTMRLTLTDRATPPLSAEVTLPVTIRPMPPSAPALCFTSVPPAVDGIFYLTRGQRLTLNTICSSDADTDLHATGTVDLDFGNGQSHTAVPFSEADGFETTYPNRGDFPVSLVLHDGEGNEARRDLIARIVNNNPILRLDSEPADTVPAGAPIELSWANSSDADSLLEEGGAVRIDWGDGVIEDRPFASDDSTRSHTYTTDGTYPLAVTVFDVDGGSDEVTRDLVVTPNAIPTLCIETTPAPVGGEIVIPLLSGVAFDLGCSLDTDDDLETYGRVTVDFGDGVVLEDESFGVFSFFTRIFQNPGDFLVTYTIVDRAGAPVSGEVTVRVIP